MPNPPSPLKRHLFFSTVGILKYILILKFLLHFPQEKMSNIYGYKPQVAVAGIKFSFENKKHISVTS
jgi:hypothetical protein